MLKKILAAAICLVLTLSMSGCFIIDDYDYNLDEGRAQKQLSSSENKLYNTINTAFEEYETEIDLAFGKYSTQAVDRAFNAVLDDHPEYFWLSGSYVYTTIGTLLGDRVTKIEPEYTVTVDKIDGYKATLDDFLYKIMYNALGISDLYDKAVYAHDYIISTTEYVDDGDLLNATAYGALINKKAICSGYSRAFQLLANELGFECQYVTGSIDTGEAHAWNIVTINDQSFYADVTLDDPIDTGLEDFGIVNYYNYFGLTTAQLEADHIIENPFELPECTDEEFYYYKRTGNYFEDASDPGIESVIKNAQTEGKSIAALKFSDMSALNGANDSLFNSDRIFSVLQNKTNISYAIDETNCILVIKIR